MLPALSRRPVTGERFPDPPQESAAERSGTQEKDASLAITPSPLHHRLRCLQCFGQQLAECRALTLREIALSQLNQLRVCPGRGE